MLTSTNPKHKTLENQGESLRLKIRDNELEVVQKFNYLGVQIDNTLDWKKHIQTVSSKVSKDVGFLRQVKSFLSEETLKTTYTGVVEPHFRYCCSVWGCCGMTEISLLQNLRNRAARTVTGSSFDPAGMPLITKLGRKTVDELKYNQKVCRVKWYLAIELPYFRG